MTKNLTFKEVIANGEASYYKWLAEMTCNEECSKCAFNEGDICYEECKSTYEECLATEILRLENRIMHSRTELLRLANQSRQRELDLMHIEETMLF